MKTRLSLSTHKANHRHGQDYICDYCNKVYSQKNKLWVHMQSHLKAKYDCPICAKRFVFYYIDIIVLILFNNNFHLDVLRPKNESITSDSIINHLK